MATRRESKVRPDSRRKSRTAERRPAEHVYGVPVPRGLHEAIEMERDNLSKADSLLGCLVISMEYDADSVDGPYHPDVAQLARELVRRSINGLDSLTLQQRLLRNKVKEGSARHFAEGAYAVLELIKPSGRCCSNAASLG